jgi:hypothetical protein
MEPKNRIEKLVEETLESLDGISRARANPFLFTRVEARLKQGKSGWEQLTAYVSRPAIALAVLCMVIFSNAVVMYWQSAKEEVPEQQLALTEEYNLTTTAFYDDENQEP